MKTMTCKQLGGPCDLAHEGEDHNEIIKAQDQHLRAAVADGPPTTSRPSTDEGSLEEARLRPEVVPAGAARLRRGCPSS